MTQKKYVYEDALTNEHLTRQFRNQFDLVERAIHIGEYLISSGKAFQNWPDNIAAEVLKKIAEEGIENLEKEVYS